MITGESIPVSKTIGSMVFAGTIASDGRILAKVTKIHSDSFVNKIIDGVKEATKTKPESQKIADKIAGILIPTVLVLAIITFAV
jgi:cation transport ATPase